MPLASDYVNAPTYSWMQRSAQITEFQVLKDTVKKLERASREQLLLENESQGAFDHLAAEVVKLRDAVSTLSRVVDEELLVTTYDLAGGGAGEGLGGVERELIDDALADEDED